jgi:hypothetical protein
VILSALTVSQWTDVVIALASILGPLGYVGRTIVKAVEKNRHDMLSGQVSLESHLRLQDLTLRGLAERVSRLEGVVHLRLPLDPLGTLEPDD